MRRMTQLLKAIYGEKMYKSKNHPDWVKLAEKPSYPVVPAQGANECGIYVLRMTQLYDGQRLVEKIIKTDVTPSLFSSFSCYFFYYFNFFFTFLFLMTTFYLITVCIFFNFLSQPAVEDWKAEYIFQLLFNSSNMLCYEDMPLELRELIADLGLTSLSQSQTQSQTQ